jgi:NitT/TauT family transport system permease protein
MKHKLYNIVYVTGGFLLLLIIWKSIIALGNYEKSLFPSPSDVFRALKELIISGILFKHIYLSLFRFFGGYFSAAILGILLGITLGNIPVIWRFIDPVVQLLRPISPIAWFPFVVLWFGIGDLPAIVIIFIAAFFPILLSTVNAMSKVTSIYKKVSQNFGLSRKSYFLKIILPVSFPYIIMGLRLAIGTAWVFLVAGEMVGAQSGLGYLIVDARNNIRADQVLAGIITIGFIGLLLDKTLSIFEKRINQKWGIGIQ